MGPGLPQRRLGGEVAEFDRRRFDGLFHRYKNRIDWILAERPWIELELANGWKHHPAGFKPAYYVDLEGFVNLRGLMQSGNGPLFRLDEGVRPAHGVFVTATEWSLTASPPVPTFAALFIPVHGEARKRPTESVADGDGFSIDNVRFRLPLEGEN